MDNILIGLALIADLNIREPVNLKNIYNKIIGSYGWDLISEVGPWDISFRIDDSCNIRLREDGSIFYYKTFESNLSFSELDIMWRDILAIKNQLNSDYIYENKINLSIFSKCPINTFQKNKESIEEFGHKILDKFSMYLVHDEISALITIIPVPEIIPSKIAV